MSTIGSEITAQVIELITDPGDVNASLAALTLPGGIPITPLSASQVRAQNAAPDIADQGNTVQYPMVNVYCEKLVNNLIEKFRSFSGNVQLVVEIRHSQDRLDGLQGALETYADRILQILSANRGDWGNGMFYSGAYQAVFGPVKHGGKNFIQVVKITFEIGVSRS